MNIQNVTKKPTAAEIEVAAPAAMAPPGAALAITHPTGPPLPDDERFIRCTEVCALVGLSRGSVYRLEAEGQFPRRLKLGGHAVAWRLSEVRQWMVDRTA